MRPQKNGLETSLSTFLSPMNSNSLPPQARWALAYQEFDVLMNRFRHEAAIAIGGPCLGYVAEAMARRLAQRVSELLLSPYLRRCAALYENANAELPAKG